MVSPLVWRQHEGLGGPECPIATVTQHGDKVGGSSEEPREEKPIPEQTLCLFLLLL